MKYMRIKCGMEESQINERLLREPELLEIQLYEEDMAEPERIVKTVQSLKSKGIKVYLHHPPSYKDDYLDVLTENKEVYEFYLESSRVISEICRQEEIKCVIHAHYSNSKSSELDPKESPRMAKAIEGILKIEPDWFIWEDTIEGLFSAQNELLIQEVVKPLNLPRVIDTSHTFISLKANQKAFKKVFVETAPYTVYFHLVDSYGLEHDSLELGKGLIDWEFVKPFTIDKDFIFEIGLDDYHDSMPMVNSVQFYNQLILENSK